VNDMITLTLGAVTAIVTRVALALAVDTVTLAGAVVLAGGGGELSAAITASEAGGTEAHAVQTETTVVAIVGAFAYCARERTQRRRAAR